MTSKEQIIRAIRTFIDNDMLPKAEGNYKIILGLAKAALIHRADAVFETIKNSSLVSMLGVIDDHDNVDVDMLSQILSEGLSSNEFELKFKFLTSEYIMHISAADIQTIKRYI